MSEYSCETVEIVSKDAPGGFIVINASDFDPSKHKKYGEDDKSRKGKKG